MYIQGVENVYDLDYNNSGVKYRDIFLQAEKEFSSYNFDYANTEKLFCHFGDVESECVALLDKGPRSSCLRSMYQSKSFIQFARCERSNICNRKTIFLF